MTTQTVTVERKQLDALKLALEALKLCDHTLRLADWGGDLAAVKAREAIPFIEEALTGAECDRQPEQEPVAWKLESGQAIWFERTDPEAASALPPDVTMTPLYTTPPQRKPLTDEQIDNATRKQVDALLDHIYEYGTAAEGINFRVRDIAHAIEAAHGIKE